MPRLNINPRDLDFVEALEVAGGNQNSDTTIVDPLGRRNLIGATISVPRASIGSKFLGFNNFFSYFDASANSIRHATYVSLKRSVGRGLSFTGSYTYGKSIDDASDASPETRVISYPVTNGGHSTFGAPRVNDRSISSFDIKHAVASTFIYDLPFGRKGKFLVGANKPVETLIGGWTVSGLFRLQGGYPFLPTLVEGNRLSSDITHTIRPDLVPGVPLKNPLWTRNCPASTLCEPYINPSAFSRPAKGSLGNAPRTLDIRGPIQQFFDLSIQKNFSFDEKRRLQVRLDLINAFNHPVFRTNSGNAGPDFMGLPDETPISTADYDVWAALGTGRPARTTPAGAALFTQIQNLVVSNRLPSGALPLDFFANVKLPPGFATTDANSFDISTPEGFRLYRLRRAYSTSFGTLRELGLPRYIQVGLKFYF
jgi:hypothetical protein